MANHKAAVNALDLLRFIFSTDFKRVFEIVGAPTYSEQLERLTRIVCTLDALSKPLRSQATVAARQYATNIDVWRDVREYFPEGHEHSLVVPMLCGTIAQYLANATEPNPSTATDRPAP